MAGEIGDFCGIDFIGGGLGAVDKIDGSVLQDKDHFLVVTPTVFAPFSLDADSGLGENSPQIISPNVNPGDKRWILTGGVFKDLTLYGSINIITGDIHIGTPHTGFEDFPFTITDTGGGMSLKRLGTSEPFIVLHNETVNSGGIIRGIDGGGVRWTHFGGAEWGRIDGTGLNSTGVYKVDGTQVVSNQGAAVADATDAPSVILRLNELLARCRTHGLIAT